MMMEAGAPRGLITRGRHKWKYQRDVQYFH